MKTRSLADLERSESFANLVLDGIHLLVPQKDIQALEPATDMGFSADYPGSAGQFEQARKIWPLYAFSADLLLLTQRPEAYRVAVLMKHERQPYGLLCQQVYLVERRRVGIHPLPPSFYNPQSPVLALALCEGEVRCMSTASALGQLIQARSDV